MTGIDFYNFLIDNLVQYQIVHMSNNGGLHKFDSVTKYGRLKFIIPNINTPAKPNNKSISKKHLIAARDIYNKNRNVVINDDWIQQNLQDNWHGDCRIRILRKLLQLPEYLQG